MYGNEEIDDPLDQRVMSNPALNLNVNLTNTDLISNLKSPQKLDEKAFSYCQALYTMSIRRKHQCVQLKQEKPPKQ